MFVGGHASCSSWNAVMSTLESYLEVSGNKIAKPIAAQDAHKVRDLLGWLQSNIAELEHNNVSVPGSHDAWKKLQETYPGPLEE